MGRLLVLSFVGGVVWLQQQAELLPRWQPGAAALMLALAAWALLRLLRLPRIGQALALAGVCCAGFAWANWSASERLAQRLPGEWEGRDLQVVGVVTGLPRSDERALRFLLTVEQTQPAISSALQIISLSWYAPRGETLLARVQPGERLRLTVRLKRVHGTANPHSFDFERWALERGIGATGYVRERSERERLTAMVWRPGYAIDRWRAQIQTRFARVLRDATYAPVLSALAIGEQSAIEPEHWRVFWRSGIGHLVSISGLHVTMVAGLAGWFAASLWRRSARLTLRVPAQRIGIAFGASAALVYALLAGFSVPTQRTVYMLAVVAIAWWWGWHASVSRVLCAALAAVVLLDPYAVGAPGFWLSFGAVAAILYVTRARIGQGFANADGGWQSALRARFATALRVQWAVTLALAPLLILMFQQLPLVSFAANALAIPVVSLGVVPLTLLAALLPFDFPLHAAHALFAWCMNCIAWLTQWDWALWTRAAPPLWSVALALLGVLWLLLPRGFPARWLGLLWLAPLLLLPNPRPVQGEAWVSILDVGQGLAVLIQTAHHSLLYDSGPRYGEDASAGSRIVLPYARGRGIARLDAMVVSHADEDHAGGAADVQLELRAPWLLSSLAAAHPLATVVPRAQRCADGLAWQWDGVRFEMLGPPDSVYADAAARENARSCVLKLSAGGRSLLLPGDMEAAQELALVERHGERLQSDVLVAAHHGSKTSSTAAFLHAVRPREVALTVGYRNRFQHPHSSVLQRLEATGARIWRSDRDGALSVRLGAGAWNVEAYRASARRYWRD